VEKAFLPLFTGNILSLHTVDTVWTGDIFDPSYFTEERYEKYRQPGQIKLPFWLQPDKRYIGPAWAFYVIPNTRFLPISRRNTTAIGSGGS
jgi:hypothetical protein